MNLSAIAGSTPPASAGTSAPGTSAKGTDDGFAKMLGNAGENGPRAEGANPGDTRPAAREAGKPRAGEAGGREASRQESAGKRPASEPADPSGPPASDAPAQADTADTATQAPAEHDAADGWPPPGLASLLAPPPPPLNAPTVAASAPQAQPPGIPAGHGAPIATAPLSVAPAQAEATPPAALAGSEGTATALSLASADADAAALPEPSPGATPFALHLATAPGAGNAGGASAIPVSAPPGAATPQLQGEGFADDIGTHVQWLAGQKIGHAHIRIAPQELGPVEVRLQLDGDRISADFTSAQPEVRQALENSLSRLREMLGQNGFELAHAGVGQQSHQDNDNTPGPGSHPGPHAGGESPDEATAPVAKRWTRLGLLDAYA